MNDKINSHTNSHFGDLSLPIIVAPMFLVSGIDLVVQSCLNGVIGSFPAPNCRTIGELDNWLETINSKLDNARKRENIVAPYALNIISHSSYSRLNDEVKLIQKYQPKLVITSLGSPKDIVNIVHDYGGYVFSDVISLRYAQKAAETNVDGLILVCAGAGGHTGSLSPFAFMEAVFSFYDGMKILAGSIHSAKSIQAAMTLGADLVYMGTKFIPTVESMASKAYKTMITKSNSDDIINTAAFTGVKCNFLKQSILDMGVKIEDILDKKKKIDFNTMSNTDNTKAWKNIWSAGQGINNITKIESVSDIVRGLKKELGR